MLKKALLYITLSTGLAVTGVVWTGSEDVARTKEVVDEFSQSIDALVKERSLLEAEIAELEDDKTFLYQWIDELMKENKTQSAKITELQNMIAEKDARIQEIEKQIAEKNFKHPNIVIKSLLNDCLPTFDRLNRLFSLT